MIQVKNLDDKKRQNEQNFDACNACNGDAEFSCVKSKIQLKIIL